MNDLIELSKKIISRDFLTISEAADNYAQFIKDISTKKIMLDISRLDAITRGLRPKEVLTLISPTSTGKSAFVQNLLMKYSQKTSDLVLYITLEMSSEEIFERFLQIEINLKGYEVENQFRRNELKADNLKQIYKKYSNMVIIEKRLNINNLPEFVKNIEKFYGRQAGLICIDHLLLLDNPQFDHNEYLKLSDSMKKVKQYALTEKKAVILLSQTSRINSKSELDLYSGKGSGEIENSSNFVLNLERINKDNFKKYNISELDIRNKQANSIDLLILNIVKNRRGRCGYILLDFNRNNLRITESDLNTTAEKTNETFNN